MQRAQDSSATLRSAKGVCVCAPARAVSAVGVLKGGCAAAITPQSVETVATESGSFLEHKLQAKRAQMVAQSSAQPPQ